MKQVERFTGRGCKSLRLHQKEISYGKRCRKVGVQNVYSLEYHCRHHLSFWNHLLSLFLMGASRIDWNSLEECSVRCRSYRKCDKTINAENNTAYEDYAIAA